MPGESEEHVADAFQAALELPTRESHDAIARLPGGFVPDVHGVALPAVAKATDALLPARSRILSPDAELSDMFLIEGKAVTVSAPSA